VLASQRRMLERRGEYIDQNRDNAMGPMFEKHMRVAIERVRAREDMKLLLLRYAGTHEQPEKAVELIDDFLSGGLDRAAMVAAIDPSLWRQKA
jgi:uncharacterized protein YoaH (UPF0181 family)